MDIRKTIINKLELLPVLLIGESVGCLLLSYFDFYQNIFSRWESISECSLLFCFVMYCHSKNWSIISKKCLMTLVLLNLLNLYYGDNPPDKYYFWFQSLIYALGIFLTMFVLWRKK